MSEAKLNDAEGREEQPSHFAITLFQDEHNAGSGQWGWSARATRFERSGYNSSFETVQAKTPEKALKRLIKVSDILTHA